MHTRQTHLQLRHQTISQRFCGECGLHPSRRSARSHRQGTSPYARSSSWAAFTISEVITLPRAAKTRSPFGKVFILGAADVEPAAPFAFRTSSPTAAPRVTPRAHA